MVDDDDDDDDDPVVAPPPLPPPGAAHGLGSGCVFSWPCWPDDNEPVLDNKSYYNIMLYNPLVYRSSCLRDYLCDREALIPNQYF